MGERGVATRRQGGLDGTMRDKRDRDDRPKIHYKESKACRHVD